VPRHQAVHSIYTLYIQPGLVNYE